MEILFDGAVHVHYRQFYVESRVQEFFEGLTEACGGQANGLCGAAVPGLLFLTTGLHTGDVPVTVELHDERPPIGDGWEDVVEASFRPESERVALVQWAAEAAWPLQLKQIDYRVRYCVIGMDAGNDRDTRMAGEPVIDRYLLQFWPQPQAPDAVLRQDSQLAAYWHSHARALPPPPTPQQRVEAKRQQQLARQRASAQAADRLAQRRWGGRLPSDRIRRVNGALALARLDRELLDGLEKLDAKTQRAIAIWAARQAFTAAGLAGLDWVSPALAALDRDAALPPPFDDPAHAFQALQSDARAPRTAVVSFDGRHDRVSQQHAAIPSLLAAATADPLAAAAETIFHAIVTVGGDCRNLLAGLRRDFPELTAGG